MPISLVGGVIAVLSGEFPKYLNPKWTILIGECFILAGTIFFPFADDRDRYWYINVPGFMLGTAGTMTAYTNSNIGMYSLNVVSSSLELIPLNGILKQLFSGLLLPKLPVSLAPSTTLLSNSEVQLAWQSSVLSKYVQRGLDSWELATDHGSSYEQTSKDMKTVAAGGTPVYAGAKQGWYFSIAFLALEIVCLLIFYKIEPPPSTVETTRDEETGSITSADTGVSAAPTTVGVEAPAEKKTV